MEKLRFYKEEYPEIDDLVMVRVGDQSDLGYTVYLLEYGEIEGFVPLTELVKWRMKKKKILSKGNIVPLVVIYVDRQKSYVNLSKKKVRDDEIPNFEKKFKYAKNLNKLMCEILRMYDKYCFDKTEKNESMLKSKDEICSCTIWKLFEEDEDLENIYNKVLKVPDQILDDMSPEFMTLAKNNIQRRVIKTWCSMESEFYLVITSDEGVDGLKNILSTIETKDSSYETKLKINSPRYTLCIQGSDSDICSTRSKEILERIKNSVVGIGQMEIMRTNTVTKEASYDLQFLSRRNLENFSF